MSSLSFCGLGFGSPKPLFQNLSFSLDLGCAVGVVAPNGAGKSSLLKITAGLLEPSAGSLTRARSQTLSYLNQEMDKAALDQPLSAYIGAGLPANAASEDWRVGVLLSDLGFSFAEQDRPLRAFSGGWRKMAMIARALISEADLLLLDEPTNHLDLEKIALLEKTLSTLIRRCVLLIVSHDRAFLDRLTTHTLFLRPFESKLYPASYSRAKDLLAADDLADETRYAQGCKEAARLWQSAQALKNIGINSRSDTAQKKAKQIASRAEALEDKLMKPPRPHAAQLRLDSQTCRARVLMQLSDLDVSTPDGRPLYRTGKLSIKEGERIILEGPNGSGKSCLIRMLHAAFTAPDMQPAVRLTPSLVLGYADQHMSQLPDDWTPFAFIGRFNLGDQRTRTLLAGAGFDIKRQEAPIGTFSPGQKARLWLLVLRLQRPNFYLLDEPTNHMDIEGQEKLEAEILAQKASCLIVSHDRRFAQNIGTQFWTIKGPKLYARSA